MGHQMEPLRWCQVWPLRVAPNGATQVVSGGATRGANNCWSEWRESLRELIF